MLRIISNVRNISINTGLRAIWRKSKYFQVLVRQLKELSFGHGASAVVTEIGSIPTLGVAAGAHDGRRERQPTGRGKTARFVY
jgi:hypothetical protein